MNELIIFYSGISNKWGDYFLTNSVEILFLAIPAAVFSLFFRKKSPRFHYIIWAIVLLKSLVPSNLFQFGGQQIYSIELPPVVTTTYTQQIAPSVNQYQNILFLIWGAVVTFLVIKLIINTVNFRKVLSGKNELNSLLVEKLKKKYRLKRTIIVYEAGIDVPFTVGFIKPKIFVPENSDFEKMEFILAHEMAHIKRNDFLMIMVQNFITIAFFFHPVVLIASGFLNYYRELICDDMAVEAINSSPEKYGRKIIDYLEFCIRQKRYPILANGLLFSKKIFVKRIEYLINRKEKIVHKLSKLQIGLIASLLLILMYIVACETITGPARSVENPLPAAKTVTMTVVNHKNFTEEVLVKVTLDDDHEKFDIINKSSNEEINREALTAVQNEDFLTSLRRKNLQEANVKVKFESSKARQNRKVKFIPYDEAPKPVGGFAAIQKNVVYPAKTQEEGVEGTVVIQAFIDEKGDVTTCEVLKGIPDSGLDEAAINAIKQTKFIPAKQENENVGVWISIPVVFKLKG